MRLHAIGACQITATQDGDATFNPATPVTQSFAVTGQGGGEQSVYLPEVLREN